MTRIPDTTPAVTPGAARTGGWTGRRFAYLGVVVGLVVSVAANIAHSFVPPVGWPAARVWRPEVGAVLGAMFWPIALLIATETLTRKRWPAGWWWLAVRMLGLLPVAAVAAVISYEHLHGLLLHYRESRIGALIGPLSVDGLMVMASAALIAPDRAEVTVADAENDELRRADAPIADASSPAPTAAASSSHETSTPSRSSPGTSEASSRRSSTNSSSRSSTGSSTRSSTRSSGGSSSATRRADDDTLRALVAQARSDRPGAGEPAVRRLLADAGLSASAARVRAALAGPVAAQDPEPEEESAA